MSLFLLTGDSTAEHPTLLHFASEFGLSRLTSRLLLFPGAQQACKIRNYHGQCPYEIAEAHGFDGLANTLCTFLVSISLTFRVQCIPAIIKIYLLEMLYIFTCDMNLFQG